MNKLVVSALALAALTVGAANAATIYQTGFEAPTYTAGVTLDGQDGWTATPAASVTVRANGTAQFGTQHVEQGPGSVAERAISSSSDYILMRAYHRGAGAPTAETPADPAAAVVAFVATGAGTYKVQAFSGGSGFADISPATLPTASWTEITLALDYNRQTYRVGVKSGDTRSGSTDLAFFDSSVTSLAGFRSSSEVGADIDSFVVTESDGDFDNDGFADSVDTGVAGGDPFTPNARPTAFADVDGDGAVTMLDALRLRRSPSGSFDFNRDGTTNAADGEYLYRWITGDPTAPTLPAL